MLSNFYSLEKCVITYYKEKSNAPQNSRFGGFIFWYIKGDDNLFPLTKKMTPMNG